MGMQSGKRIFIAIAAVALTTGLLRGDFQARAQQPSIPSPLATLTIKTTDLRNKKGQLIFGVFKSADGFPTEAKKSVNWQIKAADASEANDPKVVIFTCQLPPGVYGAS